MTSQIITAYQDWLIQHPFTVFHTVTWPSLDGHVSQIPAWATKQLTRHLRNMSKRLRITLGAMGFITLGHSGHLHSHLLILEKNAKPLADEQLTMIEANWPHKSKTKLIEHVGGAAGYAVSWKHLVQESTVEPEFFHYGMKKMAKRLLLAAA